MARHCARPSGRNSQRRGRSFSGRTAVASTDSPMGRKDEGLLDRRHERRLTACRNDARGRAGMPDSSAFFPAALPVQTRRFKCGTFAGAGSLEPDKSRLSASPLPARAARESFRFSHFGDCGPKPRLTSRSRCRAGRGNQLLDWPRSSRLSAQELNDSTASRPDTRCSFLHSSDYVSAVHSPTATRNVSLVTPSTQPTAN